MSIKLLNTNFISSLAVRGVIIYLDMLRYNDPNIRCTFLKFQGALTFSISMENCLKTALGSVMIGQANELTEVIHYIVATSKFGIRGSEGGVRELCRAIWRRDNAVKEIIVKAAKELFISENQLEFFV